MTTPSAIKLRIQDDMKTAMKAKDQHRLDAIRLILAAVKQIEVDERIVPDDARVLSILDKMLKQRRDSISQYQSAGRDDLVTQENYEMQIIQAYMPAQLSEAEVDNLIKQAIAKAGATSAKEMGKVMAELKPQLQGKADIGAVSAKVKQILG